VERNKEVRSDFGIEPVIVEPKNIFFKRPQNWGRVQELSPLTGQTEGEEGSYSPVVECVTRPTGTSGRGGDERSPAEGLIVHAKSGGGPSADVP